jgi:2-succinyl-5-enolpyruvyl-6-hydroxy-3-cyclohexene-1-carboxylate synthase
MKYSNIPAAQLLVLACKAAGIKDIVISPGSRNAPLTLSFTSDPFFNCFSIVDERCAAFFALGIAQQKNEPAAVVCTSGSALLNYYPAVAEAFYSNIPLVVISADRPPYKIDVGDGQTIRQDNVFDRHIGFSANLKIDVTHAVERLSFYDPKYLKEGQESIDRYNGGLIRRSMETTFNEKLPVHINIPFEEPLYGLEDIEGIDNLNFAFDFGKEQKSHFDFTFFRDTWHASQRKMVLVGVNPPNSIEKKYLDHLANDPSVIVFTETTSNLHHPNFFPSIDSIIFPIEKSPDTHERFLELQPDLLLTFGGLVVSKKIKAFLRKYKPKHHWHIHPTRAYDTYFALTHHIKTTINDFLGNVLFDGGNVPSSYFEQWNPVKKRYEQKRCEYLKTVPFSDFSVFETVQKSIPKNHQIHLSNSSTVRYAQLFPMHESLRVFCNRGTSGIDGSTSTALGASIYDGYPTTIISGDLSFFYDSNALWNPYIRNDFRIIVINNSGGGIFRILPGFDGSDRFSTYFETQHHLRANDLCNQHGLEYRSANDMTSLKLELSSFFEVSEKPKLLEICTPTELNNEILLGYFDFISSEDH